MASRYKSPTSPNAPPLNANANRANTKYICGFGHPLLDISSNVDLSFLAKFGVENGSCNLAEESQLGIFEELSQRRDVEFVPGGSSMNTIRVARWILQQDVCDFVGALGDDEFGCILERALIRGGVKPHFQRVDDKPTGTCAVCVVDRERSLLANLGAALELTMAFLGSNDASSVIKRAQILYCEGFFMNLVSSPHSSMELGEHCIKYGKRLCYNLSAPYLCHIFKDRLAQILPYIDILFGSVIDFSAYAESVEWENVTMPEILARLVEHPKKGGASRIVVMTNGSQSTLVASRDEPLREFQPLKVPDDDIVDTNGAGDAFVGGFLSQLALGRGVEDCVRMGHLAAAEVIQHNGCAFGDEPPKL